MIHLPVNETARHLERCDSQYSTVRAGAISSSTDSAVSIQGEATFTNNTAGEDGGE